MRRINNQLLAEALGGTGHQLTLENDWASVTVAYSHNDDVDGPRYVATEGSNPQPFAEGSLVRCVSAGFEKLAEYADGAL